MQSPGIAATVVATDLAESTLVVRRAVPVHGAEAQELADLETLVRLYRALGGGWQQADSQPVAPPASN